jgi:hypothetical protein
MMNELINRKNLQIYGTENSKFVRFASRIDARAHSLKRGGRFNLEQLRTNFLGGRHCGNDLGTCRSCNDDDVTARHGAIIEIEESQGIRNSELFFWRHNKCIILKKTQVKNAALQGLGLRA